jgi:hypothetical protein
MARIWFLTAALGQLIFVAYIIGFHGRADVAAINKQLPHGYDPTFTWGNVALAAHLIFAACITLSGLIQLTPQIRNRAPVFHRWNGRAYMLAALVMALSGFYLTLSGRKVIGDTSQHIAINLNGILILVFAVRSWRTAVARNFTVHRRWAIRLFLTVSGVWFFRIGIMAWLVIHKAPVGFDMKTFTGPFLTFLAFGQYLIPLGVAELYFRYPRHLLTKAVLVLATLITALGVFGATMGMWLPRIR